MSEILNVGGVHNNGKAELNVGIRGKDFRLALNDDKDEVELKKVNSEKKLNLSVDELHATNMYDKQNIDNMMTGMMTYHGKFANYQAVIDATDAGIIRPKIGWVVYIEVGGGVDINGVSISNNCHMLYNGERWQVL